MATMKTLNGYGFNATELNGKAASDYLQKTDTATNSAKLGGKAPEYYIQPRNLLDNSDFRNPVNQRAITSANVSAWTYSIDRWKVEDDTLTISVETDGIHLTASSRAWFAQWIQMSDNDVGKTFTLVYGLSDGSIIMASGTMPDANTWTEFITGANDAAQIRSACFENRQITVGINPKSNLVIKWAALYEGSYTADTLPPYVPKGYAAELAECQRYAYLIPPYMAFSGYITSASKNFVFPVWCPPMRNAGVKPTVSSIPRMTIRTVSGYSSIATQDSPGTPSSLTIQDYHPDSYHMDLCAVFSSDIGQNNTPASAQFRLGDSAFISLDL